MAHTMRTMSPERWRLMAAAHDVEGGTSYAMRLLETHGGHPEDLSWLVLAGLARTRAGDADVMPEAVVPPGLFSLKVTLTEAARSLLATDPYWLVCQAMQRPAPQISRYTVARVRAASGVDEAVLREMDADGLLEAYSAATLEITPLEIFRTIPAAQRLRLTDKARRYLPRR